MEKLTYHDDDEVIIRAVSRQILTGTKAKPGLRFADLPKGYLISTETAIRRLGFKGKMYVFSYLALFEDSCHRYCLIYRVTFRIRFELATKNYLDMSDNVKSQSKLIQKSAALYLGTRVQNLDSRATTQFRGPASYLDGTLFT